MSDPMNDYPCGGPGPEPREVCSGCGNDVDPTTCWCGEGPHYSPDHSFVPMGCTCGYSATIRRGPARLYAVEEAARKLDLALMLCRDDTVRDNSPAGNPYAVGPHHGRHLMVAHDALRKALRGKP